MSDAQRIPAPTGESEPPTPVEGILNIPDFYGSTIQVFSNSNDFTLVFSRPVPGQVAGALGAIALPVATIHLSPQSAKDLMILLGSLLSKHESEWGTINTGYTRELSRKTK